MFITEQIRCLMYYYQTFIKLTKTHKININFHVTLRFLIGPSDLQNLNSVRGPPFCKVFNFFYRTRKPISTQPLHNTLGKIFQAFFV